MCFPIQLAPAAGQARPVSYQWDDETALLAARLRGAEGRGTQRVLNRGAAGSSTPSRGPGAHSGSVEIEGRDGSWLTLELRDGRIDGIAVAVWPRVVRRPGLRPPDDAELVDEAVPVGRPEQGVATLEVTARVVAEVDEARRTVHFSLARVPRVSEGSEGGRRAVRIARDVLLDVESESRVAGLWLLNVPPDSIPAP